jgi:hypothetical protein
MEIAIGTSVSVQARLAKIAQMPADIDAAIARIEQLVRSAWLCLGAEGATLVPRAFHTSTPICPGLSAVGPGDLEAFLDVLSNSLPHRHPEEIRVASFAVLCGLAELIEEELGAARVQALVKALEATAV